VTAPVATSAPTGRPVRIAALTAALLAACWAVGPLAGRLAPTLGYRRPLRIGVGGSVAGTLIMSFGHSMTGYSAGMILGAVITAAALAVSFLIPRPASAEVTVPEPVR
jgi:MFS family permease